MKAVLHILALLVLCVAASTGLAAEIASNRAGGGLWSDPTTWRGNKVPGPTDDVVIQKQDVITFQGNDEGKITCQKLLIDPKGGFTFKKGGGKLICCVAGEIETFGAIRLDAANNPADFFQLRLVADKADKRKLKVMRGGALLLFGRPAKKGVATAGPNVVLTSPKDQKQEYVVGTVDAVEGSMLEVRDAAVKDVILQASKIDNTGAKVNERLNIIGNRFSGQARLLPRSRTISSAATSPRALAFMPTARSRLSAIRSRNARSASTASIVSIP